MGPHAPVFLLAGSGPRTRRRAVRYHREAVAATATRRPLIAYLGAPSGDSLAFEKLISVLVFGPTANVVPVRLKRRSTTTSTIKGILDDADLVFITGGDVDLGMRLIAERGLVGHLRALHDKGAVFEGISAGAIMLGRHWLRFPNGDEARAEAFECLALVPASFDVHGEADEWSELRSLARVLPSVSPEQGEVYGLPSGGAAAWRDGALRTLGTPLVRVRCGPVPEFLPPIDLVTPGEARR